jgi:site-specific recombinase
MDTPAGYLHWGFILISIPNLLLIGLMIVLFLLALVVPLPGEKETS